MSAAFLVETSPEVFKEREGARLGVL